MQVTEHPTTSRAIAASSLSGFRSTTAYHLLIFALADDVGRNQREQKWIVAVIFMVPVYATESFISLFDPRLSLVCDTLRDCYEAFALYAFGSYLVACLGGERRVTEVLEDESRKTLAKPLLEAGASEHQGVRRRSFINFFFRPSTIGQDLFTIVKFGLVQYMILKTFCAFLAFLLDHFGVYGDGEFNWHHGYPYVAIVLNFSQMWALYCLVQFYNVLHERLKPIKPLAKFISFKAIVFATWWQGFGIALLCSFKVLPTGKKFRTGLQDFLICIEMAIAAVAHIFVFSAEKYHFVPASGSVCGTVTTGITKKNLKVKEGGEEKPGVLKKAEAHVEAPKTSITESVQDIVLEGGHCVVQDVVLTINQAIGPVEKGVTKIQETFHKRTLSSDDKQEFMEEHVEETSATGSQSSS
ncbi:hypothetical protein Tsubulata_007677 [Turnera subulata]|uniref:Uncharacterized protein n=1 Tax=Turnera subulata TaxID=218843 RepID=A0A9Q0J9T8_9ROSI|nr:hypothetical protein Tsubulata_007677 [Turnera subulata]